MQLKKVHSIATCGSIVTDREPLIISKRRNSTFSIHTVVLHLMCAIHIKNCSLLKCSIVESKRGDQGWQESSSYSKHTLKQAYIHYRRLKPPHLIYTLGPMGGAFGEDPHFPLCGRLQISVN